ncbi:MAG: hypothetical protein ACFFCW_02260 [Candidatus Hodarchaeota archaeon]
MKPSDTKSYSMLFLRGPQTAMIQESWSMILRHAYLFSKDTVTWFPLHLDLVESVDRIFDRIVADLGLKYSGVWYLLNPDQLTISQLIHRAKYFITDDRNILRLSIKRSKPCIYFNKQIKRFIFILKKNNDHGILVKQLGFLPPEIIYYEYNYRHAGHSRNIQNIHSRQIKFYRASKMLR